MRIRIFAGADDQYYVRLPRTGDTLRWYLDGGTWASAVDPLPAGLAELPFSDLPAALQEEVLAAATRAEAVRSQFPPDRN
jgi:hypothetical protein